MSRRIFRSHGARAGLSAALLLAGTGCITVYHPLSGLQMPVVVDPELGNFEDLRLLIHCVPKDILEGEAGLLCQRVKRLFENQGAEVITVTSVGRSWEDEGFEIREVAPAEEKQGEEKAKDEKKKTENTKPERERPDLIVELRARHLHENVDYTTWTLSMFTLTMAPGISENSFVQEVIIRDARGSLLYTGELKGRIVRYFGLGYWVSNKVLDLFFRDDDEELTDDQLSESLSRDLYGQLSQMVFNANMRRKIFAPTLSRKNDKS